MDQDIEVRVHKQCSNAANRLIGICDVENTGTFGGIKMDLSHYELNCACQITNLNLSVIDTEEGRFSIYSFHARRIRWQPIVLINPGIQRIKLHE